LKTEEKQVAIRALNLLSKTVLYHNPSKPQIKNINLYIEVMRSLSDFEFENYNSSVEKNKIINTTLRTLTLSNTLNTYVNIHIKFFMTVSRLVYILKLEDIVYLFLILFDAEFFTFAQLKLLLEHLNFFLLKQISLEVF